MKRFIVRKYIMANSVAHAIRIEKDFMPDDCWTDDAWANTQLINGEPVEGFKYRRKTK